MPETWVLIGMMGSGKSSIGRQLAEISGRKFVDTDLLIQQKLGRSIEKLFEFYGEEAFREHEERIISELKPTESVLATGGGAPVRPTNWENLSNLGPTIYLKVELDRLTERLAISRKKRPLLSNDDWQDRLKELIEKREHIYQKATIIHDVDEGTPEETAQILFKKLTEVTRIGC